MAKNGISRKQLKEDIKKGIYYAENSIKCANCGHSMLLGRKNKRVCTWCYHYIFKDKKQEFEYRLKEQLMKINKKGEI